MAVVAGLSHDGWCEIVWPTEQGEERIYAHLVPTWICKLGPTLLLIPCHDLDAPPKTRRFWGSTVIDLDAQTLVDILAIRLEFSLLISLEKFAEAERPLGVTEYLPTLIVKLHDS